MAKTPNPSKRLLTNPMLDVAELPNGREIAFEITFTKEMLLAGASVLDIVGLDKVRLTGRLVPMGRTDWQLVATIGATVTQACVVTLAPVKTRIDQEINRIYITNWHEPDADSVSEMDENVDSEPLGRTIDLEQVALEAISLEMPDYPRSEDAALQEAVFTEPGAKPMTDDDAKPFAGLAALKEKLGKQE